MFANIYKNKTVLITGHTGFKGSWLASWLQLLGAKVVGIALEPDTNPSHFVALKLKLKSHCLDIRDAEKLATIIRNSKPEIIFHLAAQPLVRESYQKPLYTLETNILGTANVLDACRNLDTVKAVVVISSDKCYANQEIDKAYAETDPMGGFDPYSASKGCVELVTACYRNSYFNLEQYGKTHQTLIATARAGNVIGGGDWAKDRLLPDLLRSIVDQQTVLIRNPNATRPWQHVLECLSGYLCLGEKLLQGDKSFAQSWNFAPELTEQISVIDLVKRMQALWPLHYAITSEGELLHEAHLLKLDSSKARNRLLWHEVWKLDQAIKITTEWYHIFYTQHEIATWNNINLYMHDAKQQNLDWVLR